MDNYKERIKHYIYIYIISKVSSNSNIYIYTYIRIRTLRVIVRFTMHNNILPLIFYLEVTF